jgi:D-xylose transport system ATP-binding protein
MSGRAALGDKKFLLVKERILSDQPLLKLFGVSKRFGAVQALSNVDFEVKLGEVMALVGDNGAGKSTLIKGIAGIYPFNEGEILFDGKPVHIHSPHDCAALGIEIVYQDLALADNLDVVANMFLGRERLKMYDIAGLFSKLVPGRKRAQIGFSLDEESMEKSCVETLSSLSVSTLRSVRQPVASLSGGQRQAIAVAKAVMWNSRLVILDEPTAALGVAQTRQVLDLVRRLADKGLAVILISHNMFDVFEVADRITVLRLGRNVGVFNRADVNERDIVYAITAGGMESVPGMANNEHS